MKPKLLLTLFILCFYTTVKSQTPTWQWAKNNGALPSLLNNHEYSNAIVTDNNGNSYVTGSLQQGSAIFGNDTLYGSGLFVVKYDSLGNHLWSYSGSDNPLTINCPGGLDIVIDNNNNCYITGIQSYGFVYLLKINNQGNFVWIKKGITNYINHYDCSVKNEGSSIAFDNNGYIYLTGTYRDSIAFDNLVLQGTVRLNLSGNLIYQHDIFVIKYDLNGNIIFGKKISGDGDFNLRSSDICVTYNGDIIITGSFSDSLTIDNTIILNPHQGGTKAAFIAKLNNSGGLIWCKTSGGFPTYGEGFALDVDMQGNIYITGQYLTAMIFGNTTISGGSSFILAYDSNGNIIWLRNMVSYSNDIKVINNSIYISIGGDIGIIKYNNAGIPLWTASALGNLGDYANSLTVNANEDIYVTGVSGSPTCAFNNNLAIFNNDIWTGSYDFFIAKLKGNSPNSITDYNQNNLDLNIYPNPAIDNIAINIRQNNSKITVNIYNLLGELQYNSLLENNTNVDISNLANGVYIIEVINDEEIKKAKFIKH